MTLSRPSRLASGRMSRTSRLRISHASNETDFVLRLVFQLVEFAKNISSVLSKHLARPENARLRERTRFPTRSETLSEDEWARQRRAFDQDNESGEDEDEEDAEADAQEIATPDEYPHRFDRPSVATAHTHTWLAPPHPKGNTKHIDAARREPWAEHMSPEEVEGEARRLDEEMIRRRLARV